MFQIAILQVGALKALSVIAGSGRMVEMLLVPKSDPTPEKKASVELPRIDEELQVEFLLEVFCNVLINEGDTLV